MNRLYIWLIRVFLCEQREVFSAELSGKVGGFNEATAGLDQRWLSEGKLVCQLAVFLAVY